MIWIRILKSFLFCHSFSLLVLNKRKTCAEQEEEEVISYTLKSIRWDDDIHSRHCEGNQNSSYVEGIKGLYKTGSNNVSDPCDDIYESCCHSTLCEALIYYPESLRVYYRRNYANKADTLYLHGKPNIVFIKEFSSTSNPPFP